MVKTSELIKIIKNITENFPEKVIEKKFRRYTSHLEGTFGICMKVVRKNTSNEIMDSLIMYGKTQLELSYHRQNEFNRNTSLTPKDKFILYDRLQFHYPILNFSENKSQLNKCCGKHPKKLVLIN